jgi:hypothetical protein
MVRSSVGVVVESVTMEIKDKDSLGEAGGEVEQAAGMVV